MKRWMWRKYKKVKLTLKKEVEWMAEEVEGPLVGSEESLVWSVKGSRLQRNSSIPGHGGVSLDARPSGGRASSTRGDLIGPFKDGDGSP